MAFPVGWGRKQKITIDHTKVSGSGSHSDFIALITLDHLDAEIVDAGANSALNGGGDIRFSSDSAGVTQLPCHISSFVTNATAGNRKCHIKVEVPSVSTSADTELYIWYKKAGESQPAVTDTYGRNAAFSGCLFATDDGEMDLTGNNTVTVTGSPTSTTGPSGMVANNFDTGKYSDAALSASLSGAVSFSHWHNRDTNNENNRSFAARDGSDNGFALVPNRSGQALIYAGPDGGDVNWGRQTDGTKAASSPAFGNWVQIQGVLGATSAGDKAITTALLDGANMSATPGNDWWSEPDASETNVGSRGGGTSQFDGSVAYSWIRLGDVGSDWLATERANQNDPATFATAGTPEDAGGEDALSINDGAHGHTGDNVIVSQVHPLTIQDSTHAQAADSVTLSQVHSLAIADVAHDQTADSPILSQIHPLGIEDATHDHSPETASLSQNHTLDSTDSAHSHAADNITLNVGDTLEVQDAAHGLSSDTATLSQVHTLALNDGLSAHSADTASVSLEQLEALIILNATHGLSGDEVNLFDPAGFAPHPERIKPASKSDRILQSRNSNRTNTPINNRTLRI